MMLQPGMRPVPNYPDYLLARKLGARHFGEGLAPRMVQGVFVSR